MAVAAGAFGSCGPDRPVEPPAPSPSPPVKLERPARLQRDVEQYRSYLHRVEALDMQDEFIGALRGLIDRMRPRRSLVFEDWGVWDHEVKSCGKLTLPDPEEEPALYAKRSEMLERCFERFVALARELADHGIDFLVVPVPSRLQVYPDRLDAIEELRDFEGGDVEQTRWELALAEQGVEILDLLPAFARARYDRSGKDDELLFLDWDMHWTPRGCRLAADLIAQRVRELPWFEEGPLREGEDYVVVRERAPFDVPNPIDGNARPVWLHFERVVSPSGGNAAPPVRESPILVVGDSFIGFYQSEHADALAQLVARLKQPVDYVSIPGANESVWNALARRGDGLAGKKLVIWLVHAGVFGDVSNLESVRLFPE